MNDTLHNILHHLERMDKRDQMRTWGGFVRSILALIPLLLTIWGLWYFYANMDKIIGDITSQAAERAAEYSKTSTQKLMEDLQKSMGR